MADDEKELLFFPTEDWLGQPPSVDVGLDTWVLMYRTEMWIHRRAESLEFVDDELVRRKVSLDFEMPLDSPLQGDVYFVPLAVLKKAPLDDFDLRDESGGALPVLTRAHNSYIAWSTLVALAESTAEEAGFTLPLPEDVTEDLNTIASCPAEEAESAVAKFWTRRPKTTGSLRRALKRDEVFRDLATTLASNFLLLVPVMWKSRHRHIFKFSYMDHVGLPSRTLPMRLGWADIPYDVEVPSVDEAFSYHFSMRVPKGLRVSRATLFDHREKELVTSIPLGELVHLYPRTTEPGSRSVAQILVRPLETGLIRTGTFFALLNAILLTVLLLRIDYVSEGTGSSLLLSVPGLVSLFVIRPGEHLLATRLLFGLRAVIAAAGLLPFGMALTLVIGITGCAKERVWQGLTILGWIAFLVIGISYISYVVSTRRLEAERRDR